MFGIQLGKRKEGKIKFWDRLKSYGIAEVEGEDDDVFVHHTSFDGYQNFESDEVITTEVVDNPRKRNGRIAKNLERRRGR